MRHTRSSIALIHEDAGSRYGVSFPDLPGCVTAGVTMDDARTLVEDAIAFHLADLAEDGEAVPEPSSLEAVMAQRYHHDAVAASVPTRAVIPPAINSDLSLHAPSS